MPVIVVYGIPAEATQKELEKFCDSLIAKCVSIPELKLKKNMVSCFFPADRMKKGLGEEIIIFVEGLFKDKKRTDEVRRCLATQLVNVTRIHFHDALAECFVKPYDPKLGFASSE